MYVHNNDDDDDTDYADNVVKTRCRSGVTISKLNRKSQVTMQLRYDLRKVTIREMTISKAS